MKNNNKLRILHLIFDLKKGVAERFAVDICKALNQVEGVDVKLAFLKNDNAYEYITHDIPTVCLHNFYNLSILKRSDYLYDNYQKLVDSFKPHVIHTHLLRAELFSTLYIKDDVAYVTHGHDNMVQFKPFSWQTLLNKSRFTNFIEKRLIYRRKYARTRTRFVANSEDTKKYYENVLPKRMKKDVHLIQYGFDFRRFYQAEKKLPRKGRIKIVNIGSYHEEKKNQIFLIDIAFELKKREIDFVIHQMGEGPGRKKMQHAVEQNGLEKSIILHGNVDAVEEWLWDSDIYLHTAWYEPFGLVFLEAMAAGVPIVALDGRGNRGLIEDGSNGFFIEDQSATVFADKVQYLIENSQAYSRMSENGKTYARQFDMPVKAREFISFYKKISNFNSD